MGLIGFIRGIFARPSPAEEPRAEEEEKIVAPAVPEPEKKPMPPRIYWEGRMVPRPIGPGEAIERSGGGGYRSGPSVRLEWVSRDRDDEGKPLCTRTPDSHTETMPKNAFTAAGKQYRAPHQLVYKWDKEARHGCWARDLYGRDVLMIAERFPCFDSSDYLYEDRYFRWFFLCEGGKLTCVYYTDKTDTVTVTEDVLDLDEPCWKAMNGEKCFEEPGSQDR